VEKDKLIEARTKAEEVMIIRTAFPRYQEYYTVTIQGKDPESPATQGWFSSAFMLFFSVYNAVIFHLAGKMYVGKYFTERGEFDQEGFSMDIQKLLGKYEQKQFGEIEFSFKKAKAD
jgi:hypothetical protein